MLARHYGVAHREALRREDVGELAVVIFQQRDEAGAVRIVFEALDLGRHIELAPLEVDLAIALLVAAPAETHRGAAVIVAATARMLALGQLLERLPAVEAIAVDQHQLALARRDRIVILERHLSSPPTVRWSRRCGDPLRASRSLSSRPPARRGGRGTP